jgi:hypothetical protein
LRHILVQTWAHELDLDWEMPNRSMAKGGE